MFRPAVLGLFSAVSCTTPMAYEQDPLPPVAKRVRHENHWHGEVYVDDYHWLRDKESPEVRAYLEAENAYTEACTKDLAAFEEQLYQELVARV